MSQPISATHRILVITALTVPFCWLPCVTAAQSTLPDVKTGAVRGTVFIVNAGGDRSVVSGAAVTLTCGLSSLQTLTDERGDYSFSAVAPATYQIEVKAPGLVGSQVATVVSGNSLDVPVQLKIEAVKESVTVTAKEPALSKESTDETVISRSTVTNAPNKYDRFDAVLPLIPGVVRGPDGLINMKGARSSQGGSLVNSASATDPATGNPAMNLPIDVVESVKVIANPYDPEYGRFSGAVSSLERGPATSTLFIFRYRICFPGHGSATETSSVSRQQHHGSRSLARSSRTRLLSPNLSNTAFSVYRSQVSRRLSVT
jgi:carboxypeptidase family protein